MSCANKYSFSLHGGINHKDSWECSFPPSPFPGWQTQDRSEPEWSIWAQDRTGPRIHLHRCKQEQGYHVGRRHTIQVPRGTQEIHPWYKDGVCWSEETTRKSRCV